MRKFIQRIFRKDKFPNLEPNHRIKEAFTSGGVTYYEFDDAFQLPPARYYGATTYYNELQAKVTREYLLTHIHAQEELLKGTQKGNTQTIDLIQIRQNLQWLKERTEFIFEPDIIFKIASVMYFDETEDPYKFDMKYANEKVKKWKESDDVLSFFLQTPLLKYIPYPDTSEADLRNSMKVMDLVKAEQFSNLSQHLSEKELKTDWYNTAKSQNTTMNL